MTGIRGSYPGGPSRRGADETEQHRSGRELLSGEEVEARIEDARLRQTRNRRRNRMALGVILVVVASGAVGAWLGSRSSKTAEQLAQEQRDAVAADLSFKNETNRVMKELWLMEDVEYARNSGGMGR